MLVSFRFPPDQCLTRIQLNKNEKIILIISENDIMNTMPHFQQIRQIGRT